MLTFSEWFEQQYDEPVTQDVLEDERVNEEYTEYREEQEALRKEAALEFFCNDTEE